MEIFGLQFALRSPLKVTRRLPTALEPINRGPGGGGWTSVVREPFTGAWQQNQSLVVDSPISNPTAFSCVTLIATDIAKLELRLVQDDGAGVWTPTTNPAYTPLLRRPNRYQIPPKFVEQWILSKLNNGNTYVLKERDLRGVVSALYVLDPSKVWPLVAPDGAIYYELGAGMFSTNGPAPIPGLEIPPLDTVGPRGGLVVPAREVIHDLMYPIFHPLIGVSPIFAAAAAATQGLTISANATTFFANGSRPSGVLTAPGPVPQDTADRFKAYWEEKFSGTNAGKVAVLSDGLKYEQMSITAVDAELINQLKWTTAEICKCYHVPVSLIDTSQQPPYGKQEYLFRQYYSQCLQTLLVNFEGALDDGLELAPNLGTELDIDGLIWMDTETRTKAAAETIGAGALSPNEARYKYFGLGPVAGGATPYLQQQYYSLEALASRDENDPLAQPPAPAAPAAADELLAAFVTALQTKAFIHES